MGTLKRNKLDFPSNPQRVLQRCTVNTGFLEQFASSSQHCHMFEVTMNFNFLNLVLHNVVSIEAA
jgi:hypothetical protein